jgi:hypothetical protein
LLDGLGEESAEGACGGGKSLIFKGMNGVAHSAFIGAVGDGTDERWGSEAARPAEERGVWGGAGGGAIECGEERVGALGADGSRQDWNLGPADVTDGNKGETRQGGTA